MLFRVNEDEIHDENVMSEVLVLLLLFSFLMGFESRSVSIFFRHREKYQVKDQQERQFIELPDELVELLDLHQPSAGEDQLESQLNQLTSIQNEVQPRSKEKKTEVVKARVPVGKFTSEQSDEEDYNQSEDEEKDGINDDDDDDSYLEPENETDDRNYQDVESDDLAIDKEGSNPRLNAADRQHHQRLKRAAVNEQWRHSLPGHKKPQQQHEDDIVWEEVTDKDLQRAKYDEFITTAKYVGITLLSVTCFVFIGYCFIRDPVAFVFAFGSGCPCCIVCCPCIRKFTDKYLNVKKIIRESMNRYMPGMIINDDGTFDTYEPTGEELAIMEEIMEEMLN